MAGLSTAILFAGLKGKDALDIACVSVFAQLFEGNQTFWQVTPLAEIEDLRGFKKIEVSAPTAEAIISSILFLLGIWADTRDTRHYLNKIGNINLGSNSVTPNWTLTQATKAILANSLSDQVRIRFAILDEINLIDEDVISSLRSLGFTVELYRSAAPTVSIQNVSPRLQI